MTSIVNEVSAGVLVEPKVYCVINVMKALTYNSMCYIAELEKRELSFLVFGFGDKWLKGLREDIKLPLATKLFKSGFKLFVLLLKFPS